MDNIYNEEYVVVFVHLYMWHICIVITQKKRVHRIFNVVLELLLGCLKLWYAINIFFKR